MTTIPLFNSVAAVMDVPAAIMDVLHPIPLDLDELEPLPVCTDVLPMSAMPQTLNSVPKIYAAIRRTRNLNSWVYLMFEVRFSSSFLARDQKEYVLQYLFQAICIEHEYVRMCASNYLDLMKTSPFVPFCNVPLVPSVFGPDFVYRSRHWPISRRFH